MNEEKNLPLEGAPVTEEKHVLIVEDEPKMSRPLREKFEQTNDYSFKVEIAENKDEGMSFLEKKEYDVVVIDRLLQGTWAEFALLMHQIHDAISIVWTAYFNPDSPSDKEMENLKKCMRLRAWDYISKRERNTFAIVVSSAIRGLRKLQRQREAAESLSQDALSRLLRKAERNHRGKWIAIRDEEIVAVAENRMRLVDTVGIKEQDLIVMKIPSTSLVPMPEERSPGAK